MIQLFWQDHLNYVFELLCEYLDVMLDAGC